MNKNQIFFGWGGAHDIFEVLRQEFSEDECKKIYNTLFYNVESKGKTADDKPINIIPQREINTWTPEFYDLERKNPVKTSASIYYNIKYSAYSKIYRLRKYVDLINCKYYTSLKLNFHYGNYGYTFLMYFEMPHNLTMDISKYNDYLVQWGRMKDKFKLEPKLCAVDSNFSIKKQFPDVPWIKKPEPKPLDKVNPKKIVKP